jgi:phage shock protein C
MLIDKEWSMPTDNVPYKRLFRSRSERKIAGVCGGLAYYFRVDPFLIRLIFILFFLAGGAALIIYLAMWLIVPLEPIRTEPIKTSEVPIGPDDKKSS